MVAKRLWQPCRITLAVLAMTMAFRATAVAREPADSIPQDAAVAPASPDAPGRAVELAGAGVPHIRPTDRKTAELLRSAVTRSPTVKAIVDTLEHSDVIVWIETGAIHLPGKLQLLAASPVCRHVRITIRVPGFDSEEIAWLGHELWHAVEIARAPEVRDQASLERLYERIGYGNRLNHQMESSKAQEIWSKVMREIR